MKKKNNKLKNISVEPIIIIYILFVFFSIVFLIFGNLHLFNMRNLNYKLNTININNQKIIYPKFEITKTNRTIKEIIKKDFNNVSDEVDTYTNIINRRYINLFFVIKSEKKQYKSYIIDSKNNNLVDITFLVKNGQEKKLNDKIIEMLRLKYPEFIVNGILNSNGNRYYKVKNNELIIYYKDFDIKPVVNEEIFIKLNYNEIKDIIDFKCKFDENYINENIYKIDPNKPSVIFTFDDGPSKITTPKMLDVFKKNKVHTTFFELGSKMEQNPEITKRAIDEGHTVGSHSYNHINLAKASVDRILDEQNKTEVIYQNITGNNYKYFRVPYGSYNQLVKDTLNHPIILWNEDPRDWESKDTNKIIDMVLNHLHDGSVYVMHDIYQTTVDAIDYLLPEIYSRGYQVLSLDEVEEIYKKPLDIHGVYINVK